MKPKKYKVKYTDFDRSKENNEYLRQLSQLIRLNILLNKHLINKTEYEKVKCAIGISTPF